MSFISINDAGIDRPLVIDGVVFSIMPRGLHLVPTPISDHVDLLDATSVSFQPRPHFDGVADYMDRYLLDVPYPALAGDNRSKMELIRVSGIVHTVVLWRMVPVITTCVAGVSRYYLPRLRSNAAQIYDGLNIGGGIIISTDVLPMLISLNDTPLTVTYADGPTLADPGAGGVVVAKRADVTGAAVGYTALRVGDAVATGDKMVIWYCPAMRMILDNPQIQISDSGAREAHTFTFREQ